MVAFLSSISATPSVRLSAASPEQPNESGVIATPYSVGGKILSYLAKISVFKNWEFAQRESRHNVTANASFVNAIRDGLGEHEAESARGLLGLDRQPDRVVDGLTARTVLARIGADKQQFALQRQAIEHAGRIEKTKEENAPSVSSAEQRATLEAVMYRGIDANDEISGDWPSVAEVCGLLSRKVSDTDVLLMRTTLTGSSLYLESADKVAATPELQQRAAAATEYLNKCPTVKPYPGDLGEDSEIHRANTTAADLRKMSKSAFETELQGRYRALGPSMASRDEVRRTPTEVSMHWISVLQEAVTTTTDESAKRLISGLLKGQQTRWMEHNLTLKSTADSLQRDSDVLRSAGLLDLADVAAPGLSGDSAAKSKSLRGQLPTTERGLQTTRLHDNIYGRVFESRWIANLVDHPPAEVLETMHKIGVGMADTVAQLPEKQRKAAVEDLQKIVAKDERFWFGQVANIGEFATSKWPESGALLQKMLRANVETGPHAIAIPYLSVKLVWALDYDGGKASRTKENWVHATLQNYRENIRPQSRKLDIQSTFPIPVPSAGITMTHQPVAAPKEWMTATQRPAQHYNFTEVTTSTAKALTHGIPYVNGVSGSTSIMLGIVAHLRDSGKEIDPKIALLGTAMFMNYDGGHSIHEALWAANQREPELNLQLRASPRKREKDPADFISNYESFLQLYAGMECKQAIADSLSEAWIETTQYFRDNSYFAQP